MKIVVIDGNSMTSRTAAHDHMAAALDLPLYYGKNLDALADCLSEQPRGTVILLCHMTAARNQLGDYADRILEVFEELAEEGRFRLSVKD